MKRIGNLISKISEIENLYLAFWKSSRGKLAKEEVFYYSQNIEKKIHELQKQIQTQKLVVGNYKYFTIRDPKERIICAASFQERVLHHALMNVCHPFFEKNLIYHSYATRPKKGTFKAIEQAKRYAIKYEWFGKLDVKKYFDSISHSVLFHNLQKLFKDKELLNIFKLIINSYHVSVGYGLPIGNLTSQYFANFYLSTVDHFVLETLNLKYIRYMDDMLLFAESKKELTVKIETLENYILTNLHLKLKPILINKVKNGVPFLGFKIYPHTVKLNKTSKLRFKKKLTLYDRKLEKNIWNENEYQQHILPLLSFVCFADTENLRRKIFNSSQG